MSEQPNAEELSLDQFVAYVNGTTPELIVAAAERMAGQAGWHEDRLAGETIYGVNTGFGPMVDTTVGPQFQVDLQYNLVRSHAVGLGDGLEDHLVRAVMLCRAQSLAQGHSAVRAEVIHVLLALLRHDILPHIPEHGGVGASGDLIQLAHLALGCIGEGSGRYQGGAVAMDVCMREAGIAPLTLQGREGLALINGTSCMTGIGLINVLEARKLVHVALVAAAVIQEVLSTNRESIAEEVQAAKRHPGQSTVAAGMRRLLTGSRRFDDPDTLVLQPHYSARCVPQILGPILETVDWCEQVCVRELNSCSDNPIHNPEQDAFFHGGNFHGDYVATAMDTLKASMGRLQMLFDRQLDYVLDDSKNKSLPPFLNYGTLGLELGLQGWQFTATSTTADSLSMAFPHRLHSIPCNKDNQDLVSMGTNAALHCRDVLANARQVAAILAVALARAVHHLGPESFSPTGQALAAWVEQCVANNRGGRSPDRAGVEELAEVLGYRTGFSSAFLDVSL